jgi:hypothetical protein
VNTGWLATASHWVAVISGLVKTAFTYLAAIPANRPVPAGTFLLYIAGTTAVAFILLKIITQKGSKP